MAETHLSTKVGGNIFIQSGNIDIFRNSMYWLPPSWISEFGPFRHDGCLFLALCTKFSANMLYNH